MQPRVIVLHRLVSGSIQQPNGSKRRRLKSRPTERDRLLKELDMDMNEPNVPEESNPLNWWRDTYSKYPSVLAARDVAYIDLLHRQ